MKEDALGQFQQLVLTAVLSLGEDAYGPKIHEKIGLSEEMWELWSGLTYRTKSRCAATAKRFSPRSVMSPAVDFPGGR